MGFFNCGANVVTFKNNEDKYGMCCAWAMQSDYDKIMLLIGSQSETGKVLREGDYIGVSVLSSNQSNIALLFGNYHSSSKNKFEDESLFEDLDDVIVITGAKTKLKCKINKIIDLENTGDLVIYAYVEKSIESQEKFLAYDNLEE